jgi:hypothetical protein
LPALPQREGFLACPESQPLLNEMAHEVFGLDGRVLASVERRLLHCNRNFNAIHEDESSNNFNNLLNTKSYPQASR